MNFYDILFARKLAGGGGDIPPHSYQLKSIPNTPTPIATFNASALPMPSLTVGIEAVQDLHGYDSPWVGGAGKNKLQVATTTQTVGGITFTVNSDGTINVNGTATQNITLELSRKSKNGTPLPQGDLILNGCPSGGSTSSYYLTCWRTNSGNANDVGEGRQFSYQSDWDFVVSLVITNGTTCNNLIFKPMIRLATVSDGTFALYSNICPFSGWSAVNVVVSPTTDAEDGTTYTTTLKDGQGNPMTCYGGQFVNENGVQRLDNRYGYVDLGTLNWIKYVGYQNLFIANDERIKKTGGSSIIGNALCSQYTICTESQIGKSVYTDGFFAIGGTSSRVWVNDTRYTDASDFKTAMSGVQLVYELATPQQIPQDSLSIATQEGVNNLWADSGDIQSGDYFVEL